MVVPSSSSTATPAASGWTWAGRPGTIRTPSSVSRSAMILATSSSSRPATPLPAMMVTSDPNRRNICPNSRPMYPPPTTIRWAG